MRWLLAGCCALALINLSAAKHTELQIIQKPRFYGLKTNRMAGIHCSINQPFRSQPVTVDWYKADTHMRHNIAEVKGERIKLQNINYTQNASLYIYKTQVEDSGVYFCKFNNTWGPGTQLIVIRSIDPLTAQYRTNMKDGLIIFQALLLAVCIAAIMLRKQKLWEKSDSIYEEPETDHIYEGLAIETCGGGLYEELTVYAQAEGAEAPWE
ncbi:B-cell antigen receptor complex-associated protein beta chain [Lates calcarifer]|uniref:B-cell antigen receptor complex-associated protein beta chain n=1 Tax=Lates calcarifer TaxID=8187 RepID=A0A4W6C564_LATCA|nr:LOW QUALITY PROTEIN: B-cell antigen receptor complex-associated protein beta chain-like [Lates calcarifer]XP_018548944.1 B-cell antigen receptor complex-associated protein beta chain [Lates calcarifer]